MQVIRDPMRSTDLPRGGVGTIGNFDGVHLGHRRILEGVVARARETGRSSFAITFEPHPMAVLRPDRAPRRIQTLRQKEEAIEALGIDALLVIPFTRDFSLIEPEEFVRTLLGERLRAAEMHVGAHFAFGRGQARRPRAARAARGRVRLHRAGGRGGLLRGRAGVVDADPARARARRGRRGQRDARPGL
jgi:riboflavin kinase/FMN adenylyltransferase